MTVVQLLEKVKYLSPGLGALGFISAVKRGQRKETYAIVLTCANAYVSLSLTQSFILSVSQSKA